MTREFESFERQLLIQWIEDTSPGSGVLAFTTPTNTLLKMYEDITPTNPEWKKATRFYEILSTSAHTPELASKYVKFLAHIRDKEFLIPAFPPQDWIYRAASKRYNYFSLTPNDISQLDYVECMNDHRLTYGSYGYTVYMAVAIILWPTLIVLEEAQSILAGVDEIISLNDSFLQARKPD